MANKELKSIKFPGLADTYTVNSMPDGASANQQLATDKDGVVKWEEKPFYSTGPLFVKCSSSDFPVILYKVSSEVPDVGNLTVGDTVHLWDFHSGEDFDDEVFVIENGIYVVGELFCAYVTEDNSSININDRIAFNFPERGVYFGTAENSIKIIGASLTNVNEPEISWDGITGEIKAIDSKYLPEIPVEKLPEIPVEKLPEIPVEKLPEIPVEKLPEIPVEKLPEIPVEKLPEIPVEKLPSFIHTVEQKTFAGTFDKVTEGRDTFVFNAFNYYKISEFSLSRENVISFSGTRENGAVLSTIKEGENCRGYGSFIVVYKTGQCTLAVDSTTSYSFNAPSAGLYARYESGNIQMTAGTYNFTCRLVRNIIQNYTTFKRYYLDVDNSGTLTATEV